MLESRLQVLPDLPNPPHFESVIYLHGFKSPASCHTESSCEVSVYEIVLQDLTICTRPARPQSTKCPPPPDITTHNRSAKLTAPHRSVKYISSAIIVPSKRSSVRVPAGFPTSACEGSSQSCTVGSNIFPYENSSNSCCKKRTVVEGISMQHCKTSSRQSKLACYFM